MSTIYEIASLAGVSPKTAARILTGETGRARNRLRVLEVAKQLGYVRNQQAANLRSGKSGLIGLIVPDIANPQYPMICRLVHDAALLHGYRIILANTYGNAEEEASALKMFQSNRIEGLILVCSEGESDKDCDYLIQSLLAQNVPVIIGGRPMRGIPADRFAPESAKAMGKVVDFLVRRGRKRIGFLSGSKKLLVSRERFQGFQTAMRRHQLQADPSHLQFSGFTIESGYSEAATFFKGAKSRRPDAIVCANDLIAIGVIQAAREYGVNVPDEVAVTGFDDIELAQIVSPRLTTVREPLEQMASEGIQLIVDRIRQKDVTVPKKLSYDLELVIRESA